MALLFTILLALSAAMLGYFLIDFGKRDFLRDTEAAIDIETKILASLKDSQNQGLLPYIQQRTQDDAVVRFRYEDENGMLLGGTIDPVPSKVQRIAEGILRFDLDTTHGKEAFAAKIHTFHDGSRIIVARNIHDYVASYNRLTYLTWVIMFLMLSVVLVSFGISHFVVSRINRISVIAQNIVATGDMSQRILIDSHWDDLSNLSHVLNGFLGKIENLMHGIREVSNNIAHDLRTPLSSLRADIEALKGQKIDDNKIEGLLAEADRILSIFQALLRITNIEKGQRSQHMGRIDLQKVIHDVIDLYEPVAEEKLIQFKIETKSSLLVKGDGDLLFQLLANLIDNAIKFSPECAVISLYAGLEDNMVVLNIEDQGPGIKDQEKVSVFKHFYRGDTSRSTPGNGLGLSLVKAVVEHHQAKITLIDAEPGLRVQIAFQSYQ